MPDAGIDIDYDSGEVSWDRALADIQREGTGAQQAAEGGEPAVISGEVVDDGKSVEFLGRKFRIAEKIGLMPLLKFSMFSDMTTADPKAMAAMYAMIRDCIHPGTPACGKCERCKADDETACKDYDPGDFSEFERHAIEKRADADELLDVITRVMELLSGRPTEPPSPSSGGRHAISAGSTARSSSRRGRGSRR